MKSLIKSKWGRLALFTAMAVVGICGMLATDKRAVVILKEVLEHVLN